MVDDFTIFLTFFSNGDIRRKYIEIALRTLFLNSKKDIPIIVVDASSKKDFIKNKKLFSEMENLEYIHDEDLNPFTRCKKYLHLIKTDFVLRLLEDCAYINLGDNNFEYIKNDIRLMKEVKNINVIQYPVINEQVFKIEGNTVLYPQISFDNKKLYDQKSYRYYDRSQERKISHYLCNNILYRKDFFIDHWSHISCFYTNHSNAESGNIENLFFNILRDNKYLAKIARLIFKSIEKIFYSKSIIKNIMVTETMMKADVVHIGYYSTETNIKSSSVRLNNLSSEEGVSSTISNLKVFNDLELLNVIDFKRIQKKNVLFR